VQHAPPVTLTVTLPQDVARSTERAAAPIVRALLARKARWTGGTREALTEWARAYAPDLYHRYVMVATRAGANRADEALTDIRRARSDWLADPRNRTYTTSEAQALAYGLVLAGAWNLMNPEEVDALTADILGAL
jgi:hypothetical protein